MNDLSKKLLRIISKRNSFSFFAGFVTGSVEIALCDNGSKHFPCVVIVESRLLNCSTALTFSQNENILKQLGNISINLKVSEWNCTNTEISFHLKIIMKKGFLSYVIFDAPLYRKRYNEIFYDEVSISNLLELADIV